MLGKGEEFNRIGWLDIEDLYDWVGLWDMVGLLTWQFLGKD